MDKIDAVVLWVDGSDLQWQREKNRYAGKGDEAVDASNVRYRDWGLLRYWFRGIERNMPWLNRVFFVTNGQCPDWLNLECEKLRFVTHADYMPPEYLPTFSSHPIENNLHRMEELSEHFVLFNDDTFVMNPISPECFFRNGLPVYPAALKAIVPLAGKSEEVMTHIYLNDTTIINRYFNVRDIWRNWNKWFLPTHSSMKRVIMTLFESMHSGYVGFYNHHLPVPLRKSTMREVWEREYDALQHTSLNRFRSKSDVNQFVFRYWELARQSFVPISEKKLGGYYVIESSAKDTLRGLSSCREKMICLNDSDADEACSQQEFEELRSVLTEAFASRFPEKSAFEK